MTKITTYTGQDTRFVLPHIDLAAKIWGNPKKPSILALHGWLDNAASFDNLAPYLSEDFHFVALDLAGHGYSAHRPPNNFFAMVDYIYDLYHLLHTWEPVLLLGHSLGGAISLLFTSTFPEKVRGLMTIDSLGPFNSEPKDTTQYLKRSIEQQAYLPLKQLPVYADLEAAIAARQRVSTLSPESVRALVTRGSIQGEDGKVRWRTDPRLLHAINQPLTEAQILAVLSQITTPTALVLPHEGFDFGDALMKKRQATIPGLTTFEMPGHHHVHMDNPEAVANHIHTFFKALL